MKRISSVYPRMTFICENDPYEVKFPSTRFRHLFLFPPSALAPIRSHLADPFAFVLHTDSQSSYGLLIVAPHALLNCPHLLGILG